MESCTIKWVNASPQFTAMPSLGTVPASFLGDSPRKFHFQFLVILRRAKQAEAEAFEET